MRKVFKIFILSLLAFFIDAAILLSEDPNSKGENIMHLNSSKIFKDKPYFTLRVEMSNSLYEIRINDIPIIEEKRGYPLNIDYPVNHWMKSGENTIVVHLSPLPGEKKLSKLIDCNSYLQVRKSGAYQDKYQIITKINYSKKLAEVGRGTANSSPAGRFDSNADFASSKNGDIFVSEVTVTSSPDGRGVILSRTVDLPFPLSRWKWFDSDTIPDSENTKNELIRQYIKIWKALKNKDVDAILPLFEERNKETSEAFYMNGSALAKGLESDFRSDIKEMILWEPSPEYAKLIIWGNGKLAQITDWEGNAYIAFINQENTVNNQYDIVFRKSNDKWIITR